MNANLLDSALIQAGWKEAGGGDTYTSYEIPGRTIYVFEVAAGKSPDGSHWVEVVEV